MLNCDWDQAVAGYGHIGVVLGFMILYEWVMMGASRKDLPVRKGR